MNTNSQIDPWIIIQNNEFEKAIELIDNEFARTNNYFLLFNKVLALFHLKKYSESLLLSERLIEFRKGDTDADFINLGIAYWILGNKTKAIEVWLQAQNSMFKDAARGCRNSSVFIFWSSKNGAGQIKV